MATHISQDLLDEILLRLPVKHIVRFKSVSKTWKSKLSSPSFIESYNRRSSSDHPQHIVCTPLNQNAKAFSRFAFRSHLAVPDLVKLVAGPSIDLILPRTATSRRWSAFGPSSTGIYCLVSGNHNDISIAFCNPGTRDCIFTEAFPRFAGPYHIRENHYGFGQVGTDYKVIVVVTRYERDQTTSFSSFVYGLRSRQWKKIDTEGLGLSLIHSSLELCPQRFFNGRWHWTAVRRDKEEFSMLSFDFRDETFGLMGGPGGYYVARSMEQDVSSGVFELNDRLGAIFLSSWWTTKKTTDCKVDVWTMMDYGVEESWRKIYTIEPFGCSEITRFVGISTKDDEGEEDCIENLFFEVRCGIIISCNSLGNRTVGSDFIKGFVCWNTLGLSTYRETLEPLH